MGISVPSQPTVTTVSVVPTKDISGTVANPTTTPAVSLSLTFSTWGLHMASPFILL